jgi:hypothetical protein
LPPGQGGGEGVARGGQGQGGLIHGRTAGEGLPWAHRTLPAHGEERAQVRPRLEAVTVWTGTRGRPRTRVNVLTTEQGYAAQALRQRLRRRGLRAQLPTRVWQTTNTRGRPITHTGPRFQAERTFAGFQTQYRRLVVRWERLASCVAAFWALATIHMWVHRL